MYYYIDSAFQGYCQLPNTYELLEAEVAARYNAIRTETTTRLYYGNSLLGVYNAGCGCLTDHMKSMGQGECSHS